MHDLAAAGRAPSFDEYSEAVHRTLDCARKAGVSIDGPSPRKSRNQLTLNWGLGGGHTDEEDERRMLLHNTCQLAHSLFIEAAYQIQPAAMEWETEVVDSFREPLLACLNGYGVTIDEDATRTEILDSNSDLMARSPNSSEPNCVVEFGLSDALSEGWS